MSTAYPFAEDVVLLIDNGPLLQGTDTNDVLIDTGAVLDLQALGFPDRLVVICHWSTLLGTEPVSEAGVIFVPWDLDKLVPMQTTTQPLPTQAQVGAFAATYPVVRFQSFTSSSIEGPYTARLGLLDFTGDYSFGCPRHRLFAKPDYSSANAPVAAGWKLWVMPLFSGAT